MVDVEKNQRENIVELVMQLVAWRVYLLNVTEIEMEKGVAGQMENGEEVQLMWSEVTNRSRC